MSKKITDYLEHLVNRPRNLVIMFTTVVSCSGLLYMILEGKTFIDGVWWTSVTAYTVGYGDLYPTSMLGRLQAFVLMSIMILFLVPVITAQFASKFIVDRDKFSHEEQEDFKTKLTENVEASRANTAATKENSALVKEMIVLLKATNVKLDTTNQKLDAVYHEVDQVEELAAQAADDSDEENILDVVTETRDAMVGIRDGVQAIHAVVSNGSRPA